MRDQAAADPGLMTRIMVRSNRWLPLAFLFVALVLAVLVWTLDDYISAAKLAGDPGVFFLNFLGAVSMVLPVPGLKKPGSVPISRPHTALANFRRIGCLMSASRKSHEKDI